MSQNATWWRALVLAVIVLCVAFSLSATGQGKPAGVAMATVDVGKIQSEYKQMQELQTDLNGRKDKVSRELDRRQQYPLLTDDEQKQLDTLTEAPTQTDDTKKQIQALMDKGNQMNNEFTTLRQKADKDLTDADKARIKVLEDLYVKSTQSTQNLRDQSDNTLKQFVMEKSELLTSNMRAAIKKVAEQKGVSIVFNSEIAPYAGSDITAPVLAELNKK